MGERFANDTVAIETVNSERERERERERNLNLNRQKGTLNMFDSFRKRLVRLIECYDKFKR